MHGRWDRSDTGGETYSYATRATYSLGNRARRALWGAVRFFLMKPSPRPAFGWRAFLLRLFGAQIGVGVKVYPHVDIWAPWNLTMADYSGLGDHAVVYNIAPVRIGPGVVVSQRAHLCAGTRDYASGDFDLITLPIVIEEKAWVATEAFIGPGVTMGAGSVAGARAVVVKNVEAGVAVAGNPARVVNRRVEHERRP
ncbi:MAG: putative colanic acid biosynthesis acetyltransferase [Pseudomonadota bacterium]